MTPKKVVQLSLDGNIIKEWISIESASVELGIPATNIAKVAKGKRFHAGGFCWKYSELPIASKLSDEESYNTYASERSLEVDTEKGVIKSVAIITFEATDADGLYDLHKIDRNKYKISTYWSKLRPDGRFTSSVLATLKKSNDISPEDVLSILNNYKSTYIPTKNNYKAKSGNECCAFIDITDFHLDKRELSESTPQQKKKLYISTLKALLDRSCVSHNVKKIAFVLGSDMLHTEQMLGLTTKGTPQEYTLRWDESFNMAFDIYVESIKILKEYVDDIDIILISGNHGYSKEYYLSFAIMKYFESDIYLNFDISPAKRKIFTYGSTFIGLHHGNTKIDTLPLVFSREFGKQWGDAKYHEIKVGDKHHYMEKDYHGVLIKQLPALTGEDTWHNDNNYVCQVKGAVSTIYDISRGRIADIHERL